MSRSPIANIRRPLSAGPPPAAAGAAAGADDIVAVIPAWNAGPRLVAVLDALAHQVGRVVVVDNGSSDDTLARLAAWAGPPPVEIIHNPDNHGFAAAINQGVALALARGAEAVLVINDDAVVAPGAVAALAAALAADPGTAAATARLVYADRPGVLFGAGGIVDLGRGWAWMRGSGEVDAGQHDDRPVVDYPSGAASLVPRAALVAVGGLDEAWFLYYEDVDWGLRARGLGWRVRYVPGATVRHVGSAGTARDPARRRYYNVRNRLRFARLHATARGRIWVWLATLALLVRQVPRAVFPSRRRDAAAVLWGVADHLRGRYGRGGRFG